MSGAALPCNVCGGPVAVPDRAQFAECPSCRARLAILRTEQTTCTVRAADDQVAAVRREVQQLAGRVELLQLELDWTEERARMGPLPNRTDVWLTSALLGVGSLFCLAFAVIVIKWSPVSIAYWMIGAAVAFGIPLLGWVTILTEFVKIGKYEHAYASYQAQRAKLACLDPDSRQPPPAPTAAADDAIRAAPPS